MPELAKEDLRLIISSGIRLSNFINDILDFSKLRHQDLQLNIQKIELSPLVDNVVNLTKSLGKNKKIEVHNIVDTIVYGDENRIQQILFNLIGNAMKFTEEEM